MSSQHYQVNDHSESEEAVLSGALVASVSTSSIADSHSDTKSNHDPKPTPIFTTSSQEDNHDEPMYGMRDPLFPLWTRATLFLHQYIGAAVTFFALSAVRNPKKYLTIITVISLALISAGLFTNFRLILDLDKVFTPIGSWPQLHNDWIKTGFPNDARVLQMVFDADGANVLHPPQARRVLEAVDTIRSTEGFQELCEQGIYLNYNDEKTCRILSVSNYWKDHSLELFDEQVGDDNNVDLFRSTISANQFADGSPVLHDIIVGNYQRDNTTTTPRVLTTAQSYMVLLEMPNKDDTNDFERTMLENLSSLRNRWVEEDSTKPKDDPTRLNCHIMTVYAFQLEIVRTIINDLYLVPICVFLMVGFTCAIFYRYDDKVKSRAMVGLGSVITICMSVFTGMGLMFLCGVPYTTVHQMLPFVVFGIGLDDTFIITGAYFRTKGTTEDRIRQTMQEIGPSIVLTTFTTVFAFFLGRMTSSLPGVHWLCLYAMTIIAIDFFYQITYFIALLTLDERRIAANKRDCCFWVTVEDEGADDNNHDNNKNDNTLTTTAEQPPLPVRIMQWYSEFLMRPTVKLAVLAIFATFFGLNCLSATMLKQHFNVADYVSEDSYLYGVFDSLNAYSSVVRPMGVYFRNFDQMDPAMQKQMVEYIEELERLDQIGASNTSLLDTQSDNTIRPFCWVRDLPELFDAIYEDPEFRAEINEQISLDLNDPFLLQGFKDMSFSQKLDLALDVPTIREVYGADIVRDESGNITSSRCFLFLTNVDLTSVQAQVDMLFDQRDITEAQPINQMEQHEDKWAMFSFNDLFLYWEAYAVAVDELVWTIISGAISVTLIALIFIPHWSAVCFVLPMILVLYIDLLGTIRFFGLDINGLTYICVVVAIGLLVDFLMHVLLRYYEARPDQSREARVKETLQTMGVSIMVGGFTTFLGVIPLVLSSLNLFLTVFYAFVAMVVLGVAHGLILLPVILSYVGPTMCVRGHHLAPKPDLPSPSLKLTTYKESRGSNADAQCTSVSDVDSSGNADIERDGISTPRTIAESRSWEEEVETEIEV